MKLSYEGFVIAFENMKLEGIPKQEAPDVLEIDGDQDFDSEDLWAALEEVYGEAE